MNANDVTCDSELPAPAVGQVDNPLAREVQFLVWLKRLAAGRAAEESRIEAQYQASNKAAESAYWETKKGLIEQLKNARRDMAYDYEEQKKHALYRYQAETAALESKFTALVQFVEGKFAAKKKRAERKLKDARWEAETVYDAQRRLPPRVLKEFEARTAEWLERAAAEQDQAAQLLTRWRLPADDPAEENSVDAALGDFSNRMQERIQFLIDARARLTQLRIPRIAASGALAWVSVLVGLLLPAAVLINGLGPLVALLAVSAVAALGTAAQLALRRLALARAEQIYGPLCQAIRDARALAALAIAEARERAAAQLAELAQRRQQALIEAEQRFQAKLEDLTRRRDERLAVPKARYPQRLSELAERRDRDLADAEELRSRREADIQRQQVELAEVDRRFQRQTEEINERRAAHWDRLAEQWETGLARLQFFADQLQGDVSLPGRRWLSDWQGWASAHWPHSAEVPPAVRLGQFRVDMTQIPEAVPDHERLARLTPRGYTLPAVVAFPDHASLFFKAHGDGRRAAVEVMQSVMLRLLLTIPPGKLRFTIIDPIGLGENFAGFMHLGDYSESLVNGRIWTEPRQIEDRLAGLSAHMENVIQKYLRNEFATIDQYNREAGEVAEPYRFLVVSHFPSQFSDAAQRRMLSIAASGARCGIHTLIMADTQASPQPAVSLDELSSHVATFAWRGDHFEWQDTRFGQFALSLDRPPAQNEMTEIVHAAGRAALKASRVEVPFELIAPPESDLWTSSSQHGVDVPLGRVGAKRLQHLRLGHGTSQHVLVAGKTGSGKSTLLHALVTSLALRYSPDEMELYLVDFKQGVEFKTYATHELPHARVIAIESDREFALSVLGRLDAELKSRAERFRAVGAQDLASFRQARPDERMPRILLIVDEFQEFFVEDDKTSQDAALLLDRLVRQGRAFGIHLLLGSQTLAGAYTLARSTIGQMAVRIALQCSEADAHLILSEENSAARLLSRAGEAIYNDSNGLVEGNHPFQVVWLSDERREVYLDRVQQLARHRGAIACEQLVFEGNRPADIALNRPLGELLRGNRPAVGPRAPRAWLGEAVAIKEPTSISLAPQSGCNLLVVGQDEDAALGILTSALVALSAQYPHSGRDSARFVVFDGSSLSSLASTSVAQWLSLAPDSTRLVRPRELAAAVGELAAEVRSRQQDTERQFAPAFIILYGVQKLRELRRRDDDFSFSRGKEQASPAQQFAALLSEGPVVGVHTLAWCDSVNNLNRTWDRATLREFELRVAFQMSANDSSLLIDSPAAARLGPYRALFHSEELGLLEKFRPYRWPTEAWLDWARQCLRAPSDEGGDSAERAAV